MLNTFGTFALVVIALLVSGGLGSLVTLFPLIEASLSAGFVAGALGSATTASAFVYARTQEEKVEDRLA